MVRIAPVGAVEVVVEVVGHGSADVVGERCEEGVRGVEVVGEGEVGGEGDVFAGGGVDFEVGGGGGGEVLVVEGGDLGDDDFVHEETDAAEVLPDECCDEVGVDVVVVCEDVVGARFDGHGGVGVVELEED